MTRTAKVERKTRETNVSVKLALDGTGTSKVRTDDPFLTHMLEAVARHALFDLDVEATGDLAHHLVEDTAIVLGRALREALGEGSVERIASDVVPMDEALVMVALDLEPRPFYAGPVPMPLFDHFLRSFAFEARIGLHVRVLSSGEEHHVVEAAFKALARALKAAVKPKTGEMSTKGRESLRKSD